jgi:hypothetical protein
MWTSLLSGVASSLIAVALLESYRVRRTRLDRRPIRRALGGAKSYAIISPSYPQSRRNHTELGLLTTDNAYALADVIEACRLINARTVMCPVSNAPPDIPDDQILLGGQIANEWTRWYLEEFCPGFQIRGATEESDTIETPYYECGGDSFVESEERAWSFVVKLGNDVTGMDRTIVMLFGRSSFGTSEAARILRARPGLLNVRTSKSFFYAASSQRRQGYHSLPTSIMDLSEHAFAPE